MVAWTVEMVGAVVSPGSNHVGGQVLWVYSVDEGIYGGKGLGRVCQD